MDGSEVTLGVSESGGECGVWVDHDGVPEIEVQIADLVAPPLIA